MADYRTDEERKRDSAVAIANRRQMRAGRMAEQGHPNTLMDTLSSGYQSILRSLGVSPARAAAPVEQPSEGAFDPEGGDYDMRGALAAGLAADQTGHWPSRDPRTGLLLKGRGHPTWPLTEQGERDAGMEIYQQDGRYYSRPSAQPNPDDVVRRLLRMGIDGTMVPNPRQRMRVSPGGVRG